MIMQPEVKRMFRGFHQGIADDLSSLDEMAMLILANLQPFDSGIVTIKNFLDEVLSGKITPDQLQEIWHASPADFYFLHEKDAVEALRHVREAIDRHVPSQIRGP